MLGSEANVGIRRQVKHEIRAVHGAGHGVEVEQVPLHQTEARAGVSAFQKFAKAGGEIIEAGHLVAVGEQAVHQIASDEAGRARNEGLHFSLPPNRCSMPIRRISRRLRRFPRTRSSRLSASSRQRTGTCCTRYPRRRAIARISTSAIYESTFCLRYNSRAAAR